MRAKTLAILSALVAFAPALMAAGDAKPAQPGVLHFSANLMFWEYVTFGIIFLILGVKVIPMMLKQLAARQAGIKDAQDKADAVRAQAEVLLKKHEELMRNANIEAQKITDEARNAGKEAAARIQQAAEAQAREMKERAAREIELMRKKAEAELRDYAVELSLLAGSRVLERSLTGDDHRRLAKEAIAAAGAMKN
ncbi:MAG: ATP synthase F0 subunit B [Planctomycetes bacterium]|jgi:F-type H+-transporting ATPase subunit b|nr:ATP synthase F0 subunit B [Planctomycetota bacterium]MCL4728845.1 ATP synthase F0 subunit B [Planctomycetota bacterium]